MKWHCTPCVVLCEVCDGVSEKHVGEGVHPSCLSQCPVVPVLMTIFSKGFSNTILSLGADVRASYGVSVHMYENGPPRPPIGNRTTDNVISSSLFLSTSLVTEEFMNRHDGARGCPGGVHGTGILGCILVGDVSECGVTGDCAQANSGATIQGVTPTGRRHGLAPLLEGGRIQGGEMSSTAGEVVEHKLLFADGQFVEGVTTLVVWRWGLSPPSLPIALSQPTENPTRFEVASVVALHGCSTSRPSNNGITAEELYQMVRLSHAVNKELSIATVTGISAQLIGVKRPRVESPTTAVPFHGSGSEVAAPAPHSDSTSHLDQLRHHSKVSLTRFRPQKDGILNLV